MTPSTPKPESEFDWEKRGPKLTPLQRAGFDEAVDGWLDGSMPLEEAAAALRARIAKLPTPRTPKTKPTE